MSARTHRFFELCQKMRWLAKRGDAFEPQMKGGWERMQNDVLDAADIFDQQVLGALERNPDAFDRLLDAAQRRRGG